MKKNNNIKENKEIYECETNYNDEPIKLTIGKAYEDIFIRSSYYYIYMTLDELKQLTKLAFESIDESYNFIKDRFIKKQFKIKSIDSNELLLIIQTRDPINEGYKEITFTLSEHFGNNEEYIFKDLYYKNSQQTRNNNKMRNEINILNEEIQKLQNEMINMNNLIQQLQSFYKNNICNLNNNILGLNFRMNNMNNQFYQLNNNMNNCNMNNKNNNMNSSNINNCNMNNNNMNNNNVNNININNSNINFNTMKILNMNQSNLNKNLNNNINNSNNQNLNIDNKNMNTSELNPETKGEKKISVLFKNDKLIGKDPIKINCNENDLISSMIEKFYTKWTCGDSKKRDNRYKFIFKGKKLNEQMTIKEAGITISENKIFLVNKFDIIFKLYDGSHIKVQISNDELVSDLIKKFINKSGYESKDIKGYIFGDYPLYENENKTVGETELQDNSVVFVIVKKKIKKISISLLDKGKSIGDTVCNIDCPINFKVSSLFDQSSYDKIIVFDDKKLEKDITFKEAGITDNSQIYYITDNVILIKLRNESWNYGNCKKFLEINISIYESIFYLKQLYFAKSGGDISRKFYFGSGELDDNSTVKECGLMDNSKIIVCE